MGSVSDDPGPRISSGYVRIASAARGPPSRLSSREKAWGHALEREAERGNATAVDADRHRARVHLGRRRNLGEHRLLAVVLRQPVPTAVPLVRPAEREHPRVLPRAVVLESGWIRTAFELILTSRCLAEKAPDRVHLLGTTPMRRARDRYVEIVQVRSHTDER